MTIPRPPHADLLAVTLDRARRIVERAQAEGERLSIGEALGFTRADVDALESLAGDLEAECVDCDWHEDAAQLRGLAAKLAALLRPEGP